MLDADIEEQARKLLAGEIRTDVVMGTGAARREDAVAVPVPTTNFLPAQAGNNDVVARQQALLVRMRRALVLRKDAEARSLAAMSEARAANEKSCEQLLSEAERLVKSAEANLNYGSRSLTQINMQMPGLPPAQLPPDNQNVNLNMLEGELQASAAARNGIKKALDEYADWWLKRFYRLLALSGVIIVALLILRWIGATLFRGIVSLYASIHAALGTIEPTWLSMILWIVVLAASIALAVFGISLLVRWINRRFFDTENKRSIVQQRVKSGRADLVKRVFATDDQVMTRYFWGRMFVMVMFAVRQKTAA